MKCRNDEVMTHRKFGVDNMKVAIIGSRNIVLTDLEKYIPDGTDEIVSGGAKGVDTYAKEYAIEHNIPLKEFLPEYNLYKRGAPLKRNIQICEYADMVIAFWDGKSRGTKFVIDYCEKNNIPAKIITVTTTQ